MQETMCLNTDDTTAIFKSQQDNYIATKSLKKQEVYTR